MANYGNLVPDWLMSDLQQLLKKEPLSQEKFKEQYRTGLVNPGGGLGGGRTRYYYDYDFGGDRKYHGENVRGETKRFGLGTTIGSPEGYKFHSEEDAYQSYLDSLELPGRELGFEEADIFDPQSFVAGIGRAKGMEPGDMPEAGAFTAFTPEMFRGLHTGAYQEDIEEGRGSLLDNLMARTKKAQSLGGGLAGYGQRGAQKGVAQQSYLGGMGDVYAGVDEQKSAALQSIYDVLSQYQTI